MKTETIKVSYRDKTTGTNVPLGTIDAPRFDNVEEAIAYFDKEEPGKGLETCLEYIHTALDIELQRIYRDANRPDRPKVQSATAKFKQLSPEKQAELLRQAGIEI
jgi:uncharacterized protein (DUF1810 family)